jgi:hypothetical protein
MKADEAHNWGLTHGFGDEQVIELSTAPQWASEVGPPPTLGISMADTDGVFTMTLKSPRPLYRPTKQEEQQHSEAADEGLVGFYGHTYVNRNSKRELQFQFRVVRALPPDRWIVQFYSFFDGSPNKLGIFSESYLLGDDCALYPDAETWRAAYDDYERSVR